MQSVHWIAAATPHPMPVIDVEKAIAWVEGKLEIKLALGQQEAIRQACQRKMLVITGVAAQKSSGLAGRFALGTG